jgi:hypothetical protein
LSYRLSCRCCLLLSVGMKIYPTAEYESFPDCMHPQDAFPRYRMPGVTPEQVVRLGDTYLQVIRGRAGSLLMLHFNADGSRLHKHALLFDCTSRAEPWRACMYSCAPFADTLMC